MHKNSYFNLVVVLLIAVTFSLVSPFSAQGRGVAGETHNSGSFSRADLSSLFDITAVGPIVFDAYTIDDDNLGNSSGNDNGNVECGETIELFVQLLNSGTDLATAVSASISTTDPYVTFLFNTSSSYPDLPGGSSGMNLDDFDFAIAAGTPNGHIVSFDLTITSSIGGPWADSFTMPVLCGPRIQTTPSSFDFVVPPGGIDSDSLSIDNVGFNDLEVDIIAAIDPDALGDWVVYYDWDCDGNPGSAVITFFPNGTFSDTEGGSGTWILNGSSISWTYPNTTQYTGYVAGDYMTGYSTTPGSSGCWDAGRGLVIPLSQSVEFFNLYGEPVEPESNTSSFLKMQQDEFDEVLIEPGHEINSYRGNDLTTGLPSSNAPHNELASSQDVAVGGNVLWDKTHGVFLGYEPSNRYSSLMTLLNDAGFLVYETTAGLDNLDLSMFDIIVVNLGSSWSSTYTAPEVAAITSFVNAGGGLLVMGDNLATPVSNINPVSTAFGCTIGVSTISPSDLFITNFLPHSIYAAIPEIYYLLAGELSASGPSALTAWEPGGKGVVCVAESGSGRAVMLGDINLWENSEIAASSNQLFAENVFIWLSKPWLSADPAAGTISPGGSISVTVSVDAMDLSPSLYHGGLVIRSNDPRPDKKLTIIPVTLRINAAPNIPFNPDPADGSLGIPNLVTLSWTGGDLDPDDSVTYDVFIDTVNPPVNLQCDDLGAAYCDPGILMELTTYYWKVVATDNLAVTSSSDVWQFKTGGNTYLPFSVK